MTSIRIALLTALIVLSPQQSPPPTFDNSLFIAPLNVHYLDHSDEQFAHEAGELRARIGSAPYVKVGFSVFLGPQFEGADLTRPVTPPDMASALTAIDTIVSRARKNNLPAHIAIISGFFHDSNKLRAKAVREDARNAQWFSDGSIAAPAALTNLPDARIPPDSIWATPSLHAELLHRRAEEGIRILAQHLARLMHENPETLLTVSGDGEVELEGGWAPNLMADYSPFMIEEFRDWLRDTRYRGDLSPNTDDNRDKHTLNKDFNRSFKTWKLRYFDASGPIPFEEYMRLERKLPSSGRYVADGGFDAPREEDPKNAFWQAWMEFRKTVVARWEKDFASWITTAPDPGSGFSIPPERFFSHQIPAEFLFGAREFSRLKSSASPTETAFLGAAGSIGVTAFNIYNGKTYAKTATPDLYKTITQAGSAWGIMEYNPAVLSADDTPPNSKVDDLVAEMLELYRYRPHIIAPALWSDYPQHKNITVQDTPFERALHRFVAEIGQTPWAPLH